jgi:hypothetical protein
VVKALAYVLVLAGVLGGVSACQDDPAGSTSETRTNGGDRNGDGVFPSGTPSKLNYKDTIHGTSIAALTAWWSERWHMPFPKDGFDYAANVETYGDREGYTIAAVQAPANPTDEPARVVCSVVRRQIVIDQALMHKIVETCLTPVLQGTEQQDVPTWLYSQTASAEKTFPRFLLSLTISDMSLSVDLTAQP